MFNRNYNISEAVLNPKSLFGDCTKYVLFERVRKQKDYDIVAIVLNPPIDCERYDELSFRWVPKPVIHKNKVMKLFLCKSLDHQYNSILLQDKFEVVTNAADSDLVLIPDLLFTDEEYTVILENSGKLYICNESCCPELIDRLKKCKIGNCFKHYTGIGLHQREIYSDSVEEFHYGSEYKVIFKGNAIYCSVMFYNDMLDVFKSDNLSTKCITESQLMTFIQSDPMNDIDIDKLRSLKAMLDSSDTESQTLAFTTLFSMNFLKYKETLKYMLASLHLIDLQEFSSVIREGINMINGFHCTNKMYITPCSIIASEDFNLLCNFLDVRNDHAGCKTLHDLYNFPFIKRGIIGHYEPRLKEKNALLLY